MMINLHSRAIKLDLKTPVAIIPGCPPNLQKVMAVEMRCTEHDVIKVFAEVFPIRSADPDGWLQFKDFILLNHPTARDEQKHYF